MKKRRAIERLACTLCGQAGEAPCVHRVTGKPMKGFHGPRVRQGLLTADLNVDQDNKLFWMFVHLWFGGSESNYEGAWNGTMALRGTEWLQVLVPVTREDWQQLYRECPDYDPGQRYWGDF